MSRLQQVNLYRPEFRPQSQSFSLLTMLMTWGAMLVFFAILQLWGWYQIQKTQQQLATVELHQDKILQQLKSMRGSSPRTKKAQLDALLKKVRSEVERRRQILHIMKGQDMGNAHGFSPYLIGLSRQAIDGVSLEYFGLFQGGDYVELSGWTHRAELVPEYVQRLQNEYSFRNTRFGDMSIERIAEQRTDALRFKFGEAEKGGS